MIKILKLNDLHKYMVYSGLKTYWYVSTLLLAVYI